MRTRFALVPAAVAFAVLLSFGLAFSAKPERPPSLEDRLAAVEAIVTVLQAENAALQAEVSALQDTLAYMSVQNGEINGLAGPHVIFEGANVHIRSGSGSTDDGVEEDGPWSGRGNLIIGYNELPDQYHEPLSPGDREGSHNIVSGIGNIFTSYAAVVAGRHNNSRGPFTAAVGGSDNRAWGWGAVAIGGRDNTTDFNRDYSAVFAGSGNNAKGGAVFGGMGNIADGASVYGGRWNTASGFHSSVFGGEYNIAQGYADTITGGASNLSEGTNGTINGGCGNSTPPGYGCPVVP